MHSLHIIPLSEISLGLIIVFLLQIKHVISSPPFILCGKAHMDDAFAICRYSSEALISHASSLSSVKLLISSITSEYVLVTLFLTCINYIWHEITLQLNFISKRIRKYSENSHFERVSYNSIARARARLSVPTYAWMKSIKFHKKLEEWWGHSARCSAWRAHSTYAHISTRGHVYAYACAYGRVIKATPKGVASWRRTARVRYVCVM